MSDQENQNDLPLDANGSGGTSKPKGPWESNTPKNPARKKSARKKKTPAKKSPEKASTTETGTSSSSDSNSQAQPNDQQKAKIEDAPEEIEPAEGENISEDHVIEQSDDDSFSTKLNKSSKFSEPILPHPVRSKFVSLRYVRATHSVVFFLFALLGCIALILVKVSIPNPVVYITLVTIIMGGYFFINMSERLGLRLRYDQLGDNLYYLGFVFTLGSLAHTLFVFGGETFNIDDVISSFGIALASTILGVVLRIVAHQMRLDPTEVADAVSSDLSDMTARLRGALDGAVRDMSVFGEQTKQVLLELHNDMSDNFSNNVESMIKSSESVVLGVGSALELFSENTEKLNVVSEQTVNAMEKLVSKIDAIQAPENMLENKFKPIEIQMDKVGLALDEFTKSIGNIEIPVDLVEKKLQPAFEGISTIVARIDSANRQEAERASHLGENISAAGNILSDIVERLVKMGQEFEQVNLAAQARSATDDLKKLSEEMINLTEQIKLSSETDTDSFKNLREQLLESIEQVQSSNIDIERELAKSRALSLETHSALVDMTRTIKNSI